jgi:hypothetical protein
MAVFPYSMKNEENECQLMYSIFIFNDDVLINQNLQ